MDGAILHPSRWEGVFHIYTDASKLAAGYQLTQKCEARNIR